MKVKNLVSSFLYWLFICGFKGIIFFGGVIFCIGLFIFGCFKEIIKYEDISNIISVSV